jgi:hypothetical protein
VAAELYAGSIPRAHDAADRARRGSAEVAGQRGENDASRFSDSFSSSADRISETGNAHDLHLILRSICVKRSGGRAITSSIP